MKYGSFVVFSALVLSLSAQAAIQKKYNLFMRVGFPGQSPVSVNTLVNNGKKATVTEISDDGKTQTSVEVVAKQLGKDTLQMDLSVIKTVNGKVKKSEKAHILAKEGQEAELQRGSNLSLGVIAHPVE